MVGSNSVLLQVLVLCIFQEGLNRRLIAGVLNFWKKTYLIFAFTWLGLFIMPIIDIIQKFEAIIGLLLLPIKFLSSNENNLSKRFQKWIEKKYEEMFNLNAFELDTFEKQKKQTQLIFEDLVMIFLDFLIFTHILTVSAIQKKKWT